MAAQHDLDTPLLIDLGAPQLIGEEALIGRLRARMARRPGRWRQRMRRRRERRDTGSSWQWREPGWDAHREAA